MIYRVADAGAVFSTREKAREMREGLETTDVRGGSLVISFAEVARMSQSFTDEFLGAFLAHHGDVGIDPEMNEAVARVIERVLQRRGLGHLESLLLVA